MNTPHKTRPHHNFKVLVGMTLMTLLLFGYWSTGPRHDYDHANYSTDNRFFSPAYSQKLFHVQSVQSRFENGDFNSRSELTSIDVTDGTVRTIRPMAPSYLVNRQGDVLAIRERLMTLYERKSLRPLLTRKREIFDTPEFLIQRKLLVARGNYPQRPVFIDLDHPEKEPVDLTTSTWGAYSRNWPSQFHAHQLGDDRFAIFAFDNSARRKNWLHLYSMTANGFEKLAEWNVAPNQPTSRETNNFQVCGSEIVTTDNYDFRFDSHSLKTGEFISDSLVPPSTAYVFPKQGQTPKGEATLKLHDGRSNHVINLDQIGMQCTDLYDLTTNSWLTLKQPSVVLDECPAEWEPNAALVINRIILVQENESTLAVVNVKGEVVSTCQYASPIAYAAFLNDNEYFVVVGDTLFGYQVQVVEAASGKCLRSIRPLMFWRLLLLVLLACTLFVVTGWLSFFSTLHSLAWIDVIGIGCLMLGAVFFREYQLFARVQWNHMVFRCLIFALISSLIAVASSRFAFGRGRLSTKLLAIEIVHLVGYYAAIDVGFREGDILGNIGEWLLLFLGLFAIGFLLRMIGFQGIRITADGTRYSGNQFGVREILVVMVSVVIFLLLAKPNAARIRDWMSLVGDMMLVWPILYTSLVALICGYTRWPWIIKLIAFVSGIGGSFMITIFSRPKTWTRWGSWYSMSELELLVLFSSLGIMTWLMVLPFANRGWRIVFRPKLTTLPPEDQPVSNQ